MHYLQIVLFQIEMVMKVVSFVRELLKYLKLIVIEQMINTENSKILKGTQVAPCLQMFC